MLEMESCLKEPVILRILSVLASHVIFLLLLDITTFSETHCAFYHKHCRTYNKVMTLEITGGPKADCYQNDF